jgi:glycosyltransferase involved in cell wall biosynthesis
MDLEFLLDAASKYSFSKIDFTLGCFEDGIRTKTGVSQSKYDYWKPSTLPYFEKYLKDFSLKDRLEYEKDRRQGHAFMQSHMNKLNEKKNKFITIDKIPLISVIIPTYNCGEYISRAIDSVLSQNIKNIEILIIDDASTDDTLSILDQKYSNHPQIKIFSQSINKRQAAARNRGLDLASGEYIFFLDADDWIEKKCLIHLVTIAEEYSAKIVACGVDMVFEDGNREPYHNFAFSYDDEFDALNHLIDYRIGTVVWNKLYSRNFIEKNKLRFTGLYVHEDVLFSIEAAYLCDNYISITNSYYNYFQRKNSSINSKQTGQHLESYIRLYADIINFLEKYNIRKNKEGENICRRLLSAHCSNEIYPRLIRYIQTHDKSEWEDDIWLACEKILGVKGFAVADFLVHALNNQIQLPIKESESNRINAKAIVKKYFGFLLNSRLRLPIRKVYHFMKTKNLIR